MRLPRAPGWALLLAALFAFRLWFGLSREFFFEDETQIFLIGFRYYATGEWPYFGPDVVWTKSEIPGALQGVLVGLPLRASPYPGSPYVALAILSFGALCLFAWYVGAHHPDVPRWLIWGWLFTIPWTIQFSLHLINTAYTRPAALVFFVGVFESLPALSLGRIHPAVAHAMMGAALTWLMQIHMSWPLLLPFAALAWASRWRDGARAMALNLLSLFAGALAPALLLLPTLALHGAGAGSGGVVRNLHVHAVSPWIRVTTLARQVAAALLALGILYHAGLAWAQAPELSLYRNRRVVAAAVRLKEPEMFAHRRPFAIGGGPPALDDPARPYDAARDVHVVSAVHRPGPAGSVHWSLTLRNANAAVAFRDPLYVATYRDARGAIVDERHEFIKDIFEPGDVRQIELNDGYVRAPFASASLRVAAAEALLPLPATIADADRRPR